MLGHQKVLKTLRAAIKNNNVSHAYIFEGANGIGKRETALAFSSVLMCEAEDGPCGKCKACLLFQQGSHPDFQEIYAEDDKSISVENIRNLLKGLVIRPLYSEYKIFLINNADKMTVQAQNALLKSLEEPPPYVVFILAVQSSAAMTPTIRSRCRRIFFNKLTYEEIMGILKEKYGNSKPEWDFIVPYSDGVIGTAIGLLDSPHYLEIRDEVLDKVVQLLNSQDLDLFSLYGLFEKNDDKIDFILRVMLLFFRDMLVYRQTGDFRILINSDKKDMIIKNTGIKVSGIMKCISAVWSAKKSLEVNANFQLAIEVMLMKIQQNSSKQSVVS
ncbi:DNA polymerase-3 subunit delta' [Ruminiclostridium sufflavum DSM 19573]|uniref:DNA polymerase III subunit delta' n=1 Tax=Ruminiclostridium sufflavum DSM 19573 TaxID=1121337 RepID=A0A318XSG8_9FIRM|nr:DNA polymerase III subunit delta' [Ruminiclostridium sufflavum]PYG89191.1 DNA polymerase-3 subunit delta' [Ruminiclostridium sufflavum DSM 19573]